MIVSYFTNTKPINIIFISVLLCFLILSSFYFENSVLLSLMQISKLIIIFFSFFLFIVITKDKLRSSKNDFGVLMYVLLSGIFIGIFQDIYMLISNLFIIITLQQLFKLKNKGVIAKQKVFNAGLLLGVATIFYPLSSLFIFYCYAAILIFNKLNWRLFIIPILGFAIPFLFLYFGRNFININLPFNSATVSLGYPFLLNNNILITSIVLVFLFLWALTSVFTHLNIKLLYYKDYHFLVIVQLIITISFLFLSPNKNGAEYIFLLFPLSIVFANFIPLINKKWLGNIVLTLIITITVVNTIQIW